MTKAETKSVKSPTSAPPPRDWKEVQVGSLVIAHESIEDGWWEAIVTSVNGDGLSLRWRDYPKQPEVNRRRGQIAFIAT